MSFYRHDTLAIDYVLYVDKKGKAYFGAHIELNDLLCALKEREKIVGSILDDIFDGFAAH